MNWHVGQRVRSKPGIAHLYEGTPWQAKFYQPRTGTITELPMAISDHPDGWGTMLVHWDALVGDNSNKSNWERWMHSEFVEAAE